jgi:hypothetical protein
MAWSLLLGSMAEGLPFGRGSRPIWVTVAFPLVCRWQRLLADRRWGGRLVAVVAPGANSGLGPWRAPRSNQSKTHTFPVVAPRQLLSGAALAEPAGATLPPRLHDKSSRSQPTTQRHRGWSEAAMGPQKNLGRKTPQLLSQRRQMLSSGLLVHWTCVRGLLVQKMCRMQTATKMTSDNFRKGDSRQLHICLAIGQASSRSANSGPAAQS